MTARDRRQFGYIRKLPSGRFQASYVHRGRRWNGATDDGAPLTFDTRTRAEKYLQREGAAIQAGTWLSPEQRRRAVPESLRCYSESWLKGRRLADRTREGYAAMLRDHIWPALGDVPVSEITPVMVREWHSKLGTGPTMQAHCYGLLRVIMNTAVADDVVPANPCRVRGAGQTKRVKQIRPATLPEIAAIVESVPGRYKLMILLASWCALRFGELAELRRSDVDVRSGVLHVRRGVIRAAGRTVVKDPKSEAGKRDVAIPPHLMPVVREHLREHVAAGRDALLFPARAGGAHEPVSATDGVLPGACEGGPAGLALSRPAAHRGCARSVDRRDPG